MTPKKVVLADDEEHLGSLIKFKLERSGFAVVWTTDGAQALKAVKAERPDLVILDVMMPLMSGFEVLERMKADPVLKSSQGCGPGSRFGADRAVYSRHNACAQGPV
jgi:DNA-binding response OmpR family regulator